MGRPAPPDWRWRSFPVFFAFASGALLAFLVNEGSVNPAAFVLQLAAIAAFGYGLAHLFVMNVIVSGRLRRRRARGPSRDDEYEDVIEYPEERAVGDEK